MAPKKDRGASGSAIAGAGAVTAGTGLAAGGVPGGKSDFTAVFRTKPGQGKGVRRAVSTARGQLPAAKAAPGGILGFRSHAHQGGLYGFSEQAKKTAKRKVQPGKEAAHAFSHHYTAGKIAPEEKILRHMKGGRLAANAALVGGTGLTAYGIHRQRVAKADRHSDRYHGTLLGVGGAGTVLSVGGSKGLKGQGRRWEAKAKSGVDEAQKLVPSLGGRKPDQNLKRYKRHLARGGTPENFPKTMEPERSISDITRDRSAFKGVHPAAAAQAGKLRGQAAQAEHFAHVYHNTGKVVGRLRTPSALVAAAGAGGLIASRKKVKKSMSAFGVDHG